MGPKKKEKKGKKDELKVTKGEYLVRIAESNALLAEERKKTTAVEELYFRSEKRYEQVQEDVADVFKYLRHEIEANESEIEAFSDRIQTLNKEIKQTDKHYEEIFNKMESEYEEKKTELDHQIQQMKAKLFASEEMRQHREDYFKKKEEVEKALKETEIRQQSEIYEAEKLVITKQDSIQKSMETNLASLMTDFRQASDFAIGETINKLVRDNITLGNMLTCMQETIEDARNSYNKVHAEETNYKYNAELIQQEHKMILKRNDTRITDISTLIQGQEELYDRIKNCKKLIKGNRRLQRQIAEEECLLREKNEEVKTLLKILSRHEGILVKADQSYNVTRKEVLRLEQMILECAKRVKEATDIENLTLRDAEAMVETENREELEEFLIEHKFRTRETAIDFVFTKCKKEQAVDEVPYMVPSSEIQLPILHESFSHV